jgi:hypothetical protein
LQAALHPLTQQLSPTRGTLPPLINMISDELPRVDEEPQAFTAFQISSHPSLSLAERLRSHDGRVRESGMVRWPMRHMIAVRSNIETTASLQRTANSSRDTDNSVSDDGVGDHLEDL